MACLVEVRLLLLPPAYVVRREGTVFTGVCLSTGGGYRSPGTPPGGVRVPPPRGGGYRSPGTPPGGVLKSGYPPWGGYPGQVPPGGYRSPGTPRGGTRVRYPPPPGGYRSPGTPPGGTQVRYPPPPPPGGYRSPGTPPGGVPKSGYPPPGGYRSPGTPPGGYLTRVGQQKEYSLHGGRYASCVHAGGLSCSFFVFLVMTDRCVTKFLALFFQENSNPPPLLFDQVLWVSKLPLYLH